jgi:FKBP-type peptidyl-prolyl cis-trans isomerase SlyD
MRSAHGLALLGLVLLPSQIQAEEAKAGKEEPVVVEDGRTVSIEYTLTLEDGTRADSNVGEEPLQFEQGRQQILPALERELEGMKVGEQKEVTLPPDQAYGSVDPEAFQEVEAERVPEEARHEGARLVAQDPAGKQHMIRVHEVKGENLVLDLNHPLAGQTLHFDVKVIGID